MRRLLLGLFITIIISLPSHAVLGIASLLLLAD